MTAAHEGTAAPALDLLTAHFERMKGQTYTVPGIKGPDGKPLVVYFDPPTSAAGARVRRRAGTDEQKITLHTVMEFARNADGTPMFPESADTVRALTECVSGKVLSGIAMAILSASDVEDLGND